MIKIKDKKKIKWLVAGLFLFFCDEHFVGGVRLW